MLIKAVTYGIPAFIGNKASEAWRTLPDVGLSDKISSFLSAFEHTITNPMPSFNLIDIAVGLAAALAVAAFLYNRKLTAKNYRHKEEYGSARWGTERDIEPYMDKRNFRNNIILTQTEGLTMGKPPKPMYGRNKNVMVVGGAGTGKTRFVVKPNLMQMHSSYVVTDPKGTVMVECGKMLADNGYNIKVFNTVDFSKSMHYNPFAYIHKETTEQDILKFVEALIKNTSGSGEQKNEDFWVKAERLIYTSYIAMMFCTSPLEERNFKTLIDMIVKSEVREDDESFMNGIDLLFESVNIWINDSSDEYFSDVPDIEDNAGADNVQEDSESEGEESEQETKEENQKSPQKPTPKQLIKDVYYNSFHFDTRKPSEYQKRIGRFAYKQYKGYKLAAGKTAKSILVSCDARLGSFTIDTILDITAYDEMGLEKIGDEPTALFIIISDTDSTFNFLVSIMYTQMFNLLCTKADNNPDGSGKLKFHVRCILDEFANIGVIPQFEKLIATIRSREISAVIILQAKSQLKAIYKDNADTIEGNCDSFLFLGGTEKTTLKEVSEMLGKETIDDYNTSETRGQSSSSGVNYSKHGLELMSVDQLMVMDGGKCILRIRGVRPFMSDKYDITKHPQYGSLFDADPKNKFDIQKYMRDRNRLKLAESTTVTMYKGGA